MAAVLCRRRMGSVYERFVGLVSGFWIYLGLFISVGMDTLSLWFLDVCSELWLGLAARRFRSGVEYGSESDESSAAVHSATTAVDIGA